MVMDRMKTNRLHYIILGIILVCSGYLILKNLDSATLWDDEAQTAILAQNFLKTGHFTGWDGRNLYAYRNGTVLNKDLKIINPPLQFLVAAASFKMLGVNTFTARLPFALFGWLTILLLYWVVRKELPHLPSMALYAAGFLGMFAEYLLYARNCRYYSLVIFFALLTFYFYRRFIEKINWQAIAGLVVSAVLMYFAQFQMGAAFGLALAAMFVLFDRKKLSARHWQMLIVAGIVVVLAVVPYSLYFRLWDRQDMLMKVGFFGRAPKLLLVYSRYSIFSGIAPWVLLVLTGIGLWKGTFDAAKKTFLARMLFLTIANFVIVALTTKQDFTGYQMAQLRYLVVCYPFTAMLAAGIIHWIEGKKKWLAVAALFVFAGTNCLSYMVMPMGITNKFMPLLYNYLDEIHHPYPTSYEFVYDYLKNNACQNETYYTVPEYMSYPLQFYIGDYLYTTCVVDSNTHLGANRLKTLSPRLLKEDNFPDWFVALGNHAETAAEFAMISREVSDSTGTRYCHEYVVDTVMPVYWDQTNRPEIISHFWRNKKPLLTSEDVIVCHKLIGDEHVWLTQFQKIIDAAIMFKDTTLETIEFKKLYAVYIRDPALIRNNFEGNRVTDFFKAYEEILFDKKKYDDAEQVLHTLMQLEPRNGMHYYMLARIMFGEQKYDRTIETCDKIIQAIPEIPFPYQLKAQAFVKLRNGSMAVNTLRTGIAAIKNVDQKQLLQASLDSLL
jgi:hypothetical protein